MDNLSYLFFAYAAIWTGLLFFLVQIAKRLSVMQKQLESLQQEKESR